MELNAFAEGIIKHLSRIANSLEVIEAAAKGGKVSGPAATTTSAPAGETAAAKKKPEAAEAAAAAAANAPKADRAAVNKALVSVKDTISKDAAQAIYKKFGYEAMSKIEDKHFDEVLALAEKELEDFANKTGAYEVVDAPADDSDDL